ncbi:MAG: hypothetical protein E4H13_06935, partial [Calditrichales bacterium]
DFLQQVGNLYTVEELRYIKRVADAIMDQSDGVTHTSDKKETVLVHLKSFQTETDPQTLAYWQTMFPLAVLFTRGDGTAYLNLGQLGGKKSWTTDSEPLLLELSGLLEPLALWQKQFTTVTPATIDYTVLEKLKSFFQLYTRVENRFNAQKKAQAAVDYEDLQLLTLRLMRDNPEVRKQIAGRFRYVMVDEFQDTNQLQWEIIALLTDEQPDKLFIVGDPKQSIYGFRSADVRVFNRVKAEFAAVNPESDHLLYESFRFKNGVSDFVNRIFPGILKADRENPWEVQYDAMETRRDDREGGIVEIALMDKSDGEERQSGFIANRILALLTNENIHAGDIAIILRTRTHLNEIENELRDHEIPFQTIGGIGFYQGQEIYDTLHLLRFLINPTDDLALIGVLRSPFADISDEALLLISNKRVKEPFWELIQSLGSLEFLADDDQAKLTVFIENACRWIRRRDRIGYFDLLNEVFNHSLYRAVVSTDYKGPQILANIEKILKIALEFEKGRLTSMVDFAASLNRLIRSYLKEGEAPVALESKNAVKVLTIHQSKGLQFPVVFLPYLEQRLTSSARQTVYFDENYGLAPVLSDAGEKISYFLLDLLKRRQLRRELAELKRLFYVGCTRAADHLVLSGEIKNGKTTNDTPLKWLLDSLEVRTEPLQEELKIMGEALGYRIHTNFTELGKSGERKRQSMIKSLEQLESITAPDDAGKGQLVYQIQTNDQPKAEMFSATQILTFLENPLEYHRRYHLGYFEDDYEKLGMGVVSEEDALLRGTLVHRLLERYPDDDVDALLSESDIVDETKLSEMRTKLIQVRETIAQSESLRSVMAAKEYRTEVGMISRINGDFLTGTLDRIYRNGQGSWSIVDYKTNNIDKSAVEKTAKRYQVQIEIYTILLASAFPGQTEYEIGLYFVEPDILYSKTYQIDEIKTFMGKYVAVIGKIKEFYPYTDELLAK